MWIIVTNQNKSILIFISQEIVEIPTERPVPPTISVVISSPVIQIIDVGETIRLPCTAYHNIQRVRKLKYILSACWDHCYYKYAYL